MTKTASRRSPQPPGRAGATPWLVLLTLAAFAGCTPGSLARTSEPQLARDVIPARTLADQLGMRISRASRYSISMTGPTDSLLITGPPRPGVLLNGRKIGNGSGVLELDGRLMVDRRLAGEIQRQMSRRAAPRPVPTPAPGSNALTGAVVALDAGHGGDDPGAPNHYGPCESILVMDAVHRVARRLQQRGVRVVLTRSDDTFVELNERAAIANRAGADLFVSIHADSHPSADIDGFTMYVARQSGQQAKSLAALTAESMQRRIATFRGTRKQDFRVLVRTKMPAVLIEMGYLTNRTEGKKLSTAEYRQELADAIADGIAAYLSSQP